MRKVLILAVTALGITVANSGANAQVDLSAYADAEGYIDVQTLACRPDVAGSGRLAHHLV
jgi:hypothetical protein